MGAPRTGDPVHPDLRRIARVLPRHLIGPRSLSTVRRFLALADRPRDGVEVLPVGGVSVRLHHPGAADGPLPAVLWIHGGGYVIGNAAQDDKLCARLARHHGALVAAVDYRLAPEHPFPTPLHDCHDALVWLAARPEVDATRVAIAGASAGAGLAAALALLARDRGEVAPVAQVLTYPMLDDRTAVDPSYDRLDVRGWDNASNRFGWASYLGRPPGSPAISGLAAPSRHDDLAGLPQAWIGVGTNDVFHDEDVAYAQRLREAGVRCELEVVPGAFHAFDGIARRAPVVRAFAASRDAFLDDVLGDGTAR